MDFLGISASSFCIMSMQFKLFTRWNKTLKRGPLWELQLNTLVGVKNNYEWRPVIHFVSPTVVTIPPTLDGLEGEE